MESVPMVGMDAFELSEAVVSQLTDAYSYADIQVTDVVVGQNLVLIEVTRASDDERFVGVAHRPPVAFPPTQTLVDSDGLPSRNGPLIPLLMRRSINELRGLWVLR